MATPNTAPTFLPNIAVGGHPASSFGTPDLAFLGVTGVFGAGMDAQDALFKYAVNIVLNRVEIFYIGFPDNTKFAIMIKRSEVDTLIPIIQAQADSDYPGVFQFINANFLLGSTIIM
jgi:hypothetical protein|tara:strand:+ start:3530 stop:3880 length:351 start_codon:yes stop_codon:yes gene_type:complete